MKPPIVLAVLPALLLAACSHTIERETVVERPVAPNAVVVERPAVVVETPAARGRVQGPAAVEPRIVAAPDASARSCTLPSGSFVSGSISCQDRFQYRCDDGNWRALNTGC